MTVKPHKHCYALVMEREDGFVDCACIHCMHIKPGIKISKERYWAPKIKKDYEAIDRERKARCAVLGKKYGHDYETIRKHSLSYVSRIKSIKRRKDLPQGISTYTRGGFRARVKWEGITYCYFTDCIHDGMVWLANKKKTLNIWNDNHIIEYFKLNAKFRYQ